MQLSNTFRYFYFQPEGGVISLGFQLRLIVVLGIGIPYILYQKLLCLPLVDTSPTLSGICTLTLEGSQVFGISVQTDSGIRFWHTLYTLPEVIVPISGVHLSNTFRYFYFQPEGGVISLGSQLRLIVVFGIGIPYILYQKLLCLPLVCTSPTLSGISTFRQEGVKTLFQVFLLLIRMESNLFGVSAQTDRYIWIWHSL